MGADSPAARAGLVLVTGATGFIGRAACEALAQAGHAVVRGARRAPDQPSGGQTWAGYGEVGPDTRWDEALAGVGTVVHLAGLAHLPDEAADTAAATFHRVNVEGTGRLAEAAIGAGVRRFILMSSALVHGQSSAGRRFTEADAPRPETAYARSKLASEQRLAGAARATGMEWVILRPPMVIGEGARGNFARLVKLVRMGVPLPIGAATAPKSFIGIDNLASAVVRCVAHAGAANQTLLVADSETTSTTGLVRLIAAALGRRAWLPGVPLAALQAAARLGGRERDFQRLFDALEIDSAKIRAKLEWTPPVSLAEGVRRAVVGPAA